MKERFALFMSELLIFQDFFLNDALLGDATKICSGISNILRGWGDPLITSYHFSRHKSPASCLPTPDSHLSPLVNRLLSCVSHLSPLVSCLLSPSPVSNLPSPVSHLLSPVSLLLSLISPLHHPYPP